MEEKCFCHLGINFVHSKINEIFKIYATNSYVVRIKLTVQFYIPIFSQSHFKPHNHSGQHNLGNN